MFFVLTILRQLSSYENIYYTLFFLRSPSFLVSFYFLFDTSFIGNWFKPLKKMAYWAHHKIARTFFSLIFIPMKIRYEEGVDLKNQYVIIANHFSYIDIPALAALNILSSSLERCKSIIFRFLVIFLKTFI